MATPRIDIGLRVKVKKSFFDRETVLAALSKAEHAVLSKAGAYVMRDARQNVRNRKRPSRPGEGPTNQTGRLKDNIFFAFDQQTRSVVIGPTLLPRSTGAQSILEFGGVTESPERKINNTQTGGNFTIPAQAVTIEPRPYMAPALEKNAPKLPNLFKNSVVPGIGPR